MPRSCGRSRRNISPRSRSAPLAAISTFTIQGPRGVSKRTEPTRSSVFSAAWLWQARRRRKRARRMGDCYRAVLTQYQLEFTWPKSCEYLSGGSRCFIASRYAELKLSCEQVMPAGQLAPAPAQDCEQ